MMKYFIEEDNVCNQFFVQLQTLSRQSQQRAGVLLQHLAASVHCWVYGKDRLIPGQRLQNSWSIQEGDGDKSDDFTVSELANTAMFRRR